MPANKLSKEERQRKVVRMQLLGLVLLLLALIVTSVVTGLMASGAINIKAGPNGPAESMTDAQLICDRAIAEEHGATMQSFVVDDMSSRTDKKGGGYKVYYELNLYRDASRSSGVKKHFVNCFVSSSGRVNRMDVFEDKIFVPKPIQRSSGNAFGL
jgi:hypothetical protein